MEDAFYGSRRAGGICRAVGWRADPCRWWLARLSGVIFPFISARLARCRRTTSVTVRARVDGELQQIYFQEGQNVQKGDLLAQIDPRTYQAQLDQAKAKKAQDEAQLANARIVLSRNALLLKNSVVDQQTYDTQKYAVDQLQALVAADQAALDNAQTQLDYARITAPISGRVGIRLVDAGNIVRSTDTAGMLTINQVQPISVFSRCRSRN